MGPETASLPGWQYGLLGVAAFVFAGVIVYLFKFYTRRERRWEFERKAFAEERKAFAVKEASWDDEREKERLRIRGEYEEKHRELVEKYSDDVREEREANRVHEDAVRREFSEAMEAISEKASASSQALVEMLQKFYDRFVGPSRGRHH